MAKGVIFTAQADAITHSVFLVNGNGADAGVNIYLKQKNGTSRRIMPKDMVLKSRFQWETLPVFSMEAEDVLEGDSTVTGVDYSVVGGTVP